MPLYEALNAEKNELRLLHIKAGEGDAPIKCSLEKVPHGRFSRHAEGIYDWTSGEAYQTSDNLQTGATYENSAWTAARAKHQPLCWVPEYEALSYVWGDGPSTVDIEVNGKLVKVRKNLKDALFALRLSDTERVMWIDALCINQDDIKERSAQVSRMPAIYQRAIRTISWLGLADAAALDAMDALERLGGSIAHWRAYKSPPYFDWYGPQFSYGFGILEEIPVVGPEERHALLENLATLNDLSEREWLALRNFFSDRPYWRRMWIIQEIVHSRDIIFQCGPRQMSLQTLMHLVSSSPGIPHDPHSPDVASSAKQHRRLLDIMESPNKMLFFRSVARHWTRATKLLGWEHHATSFLNILEEFRHFECTDPRDRIYALLGLPSIDRSMPLPEPDYSKTVSEVYCETVKAIIQHTADLSILCVPRDLRGTQSEHRLPSWVPNWMDKSNETSNLLATGPPEVFKEDCVFRAAKETSPKGPDFNFQELFASHGFVPKKSRPIVSGRSFSCMAGAGMGSTGLIERPILPARLPGSNIHQLELGGYVVDDIRLISDPIPEQAFDNELWKTHILQWKTMIHTLLVALGGGPGNIDPSLTYDKLERFITVILRAELLRPQGMEQKGELPLLLTYVIHFGVWTGYLKAEDAACPINEAMLSLAFDDKLKRSVRGRKFAITTRGIMALVPESASKWDNIAIVFGCDLPLVVRRVGTTQDDSEPTGCWTLLGCAYMDGYMTGDGLERAEREGLKEERFRFL